MATRAKGPSRSGMLEKKCLRTFTLVRSNASLESLDSMSSQTTVTEHVWEVFFFELTAEGVIRYSKNADGGNWRGSFELASDTVISSLSETSFQIIFSGTKALKVRAESDNIAQTWKASLRAAVFAQGGLRAVVCPGTSEVFVLPKRCAFDDYL